MANAKRRKPAGTTKKRGRPDRVCFVLMPFKDPFNTYYGRVYVPAITKAGLKPVRIDELFRPGPVVKDIWEHVVAAQVLVAELTERNANVFYELGLAHAVGKPVVLVTQNLEDVPFDLRHLRVLSYNTADIDWAANLQDGLTEAIRQTLADPVSALALPPPQEAQARVTTASPSEPRPTRPATQKQPVSSSSNISSQVGLQMFAALPEQGKIKLMELALRGTKPTEEEILGIFLDAMKPQG